MKKSLSSLHYIVFAVLALFSAIIINSIITNQKTKITYLHPTSSQEELRELVLNSLSSNGIDSSDIQIYRDEENILHLKIDLPLETYNQMEETLEDELKMSYSPVVKKEKMEESAKDFYMWEIQDRNEENLVLLFSCQKENIGEEILSRKAAQENRAALIIDDMGYNLNSLEKICALKRALTVSILPFSPHAKQTAQIADENGLEVMLHLPLQSRNNNGENNVKGIILSEMSEEEVATLMEENLIQIPHIKGVNNHMGSKITSNRDMMQIILERIKQMNLFFVDSVTTTRTIAFDLAQDMGIPSARRHIFLDSINDKETIRKKLLHFFRRAQKRGEAVAICHPYEETLQVLQENIHLADEYDVKLVFASQIVK